MNTGPIKCGDLVKCDVRGQEFYAVWRGPNGQGVREVDPIVPSVSYRTVKANEVVAHYRKSKASLR